MATYILNVAFFDDSVLSANKGILYIRSCNGGTWSHELSDEFNIEYFLNYINDFGSAISGGCNVELDGKFIGTTEY
jgi:hypothetical protein